MYLSGTPRIVTNLVISIELIRIYYNNNYVLKHTKILKRKGITNVSLIKFVIELRQFRFSS